MSGQAIGAIMLAFLGVAGIGSIARAQDFDDEPEVPAAVNPQFMVADETFDQWVFGNVQNGGGAKTRLKALLQLQIQEIERACKLSDAQKTKLELAGRGDLKRFNDRVEEKRKRFQLVKNDQQKFQNFFQEIQPLQAEVQAGLFGEGSFFSKTIAKTLDDDQAVAYADATRERQRFRYRAKRRAGGRKPDRDPRPRRRSSQATVDAFTGRDSTAQEVWPVR